METIQQIVSDHEEGRLNTLQSFLIHLGNCLKKFKEQLENFNRSQAEANVIAKDMTRRYTKKLDIATNYVVAAKERHGTALWIGNIATGAKVTSVTVLVGGLMMTGLGLIAAASRALLMDQWCLSI